MQEFVYQQCSLSSAIIPTLASSIVKILLEASSLAAQNRRRDATWLIGAIGGACTISGGDVGIIQVVVKSMVPL